MENCEFTQNILPTAFSKQQAFPLFDRNFCFAALMKSAYFPPYSYSYRL